MKISTRIHLRGQVNRSLHFYIKGNAPQEMKAELDAVYSTSAPSFETV